MGKLILKGKHRIYCGDSTSKDDVAFLMAGALADLVFTDPPYGMKLDTDFSKMGGLKHAPVTGDHSDFKDELITTIFKFDYAKEMFIFGADYFAQLINNRNDGSWVVWDKRSRGEENIGMMDGQFGSDFELCWSKTKHKRQLARIVRPTGYYAARTADKGCGHPTQKPIALVEWFFERFGKDSVAVVDLYLGSGTTLIACEKTNRKCYGMEIEPLYIDVILNRYKSFCSRPIVREDGVLWES